MAKFGSDFTIAFLGNAYYDSRTVNLEKSLTEKNVDYRIISFDWQREDFNSTEGRTSVYKLTKGKITIFFYLHFMLKLFVELAKGKSKVYLAEDVYSLPVCWLFARLNGAKLLYNSRELYPFIGGLRNKQRIQKIITFVEKSFINKTDIVLTTGSMDSEFLEEYYGINNTYVIRNLPQVKKSKQPYDIKSELGIPVNSRLLVYQGVIHDGRGIAKVLHALPKVNNIYFLIIGDGPSTDKFKQLAEELKVADKVFFYGRVPHSKLLDITAGCDLGIALIENISISYYYALPNKLFEYIMSEVPVISSNLPQMEKIVNDYNVGWVVDPEDEQKLLTQFQVIDNLSIDEINKIKENCKKASETLNWQVEFESFYTKYRSLFP